MDATIVIFLFVAVLIVAAVVFVGITGGFAFRGRSLDTAKYRSRWLSIEQQLKRGDVASYQLCILNADKLLDQALKDLGTKGQTMGERMKMTKWTNANAVWEAHKLRNRIAHEPDVTIEYDAARRALAGFKRGLKDVGAI